MVMVMAMRGRPASWAVLVGVLANAIAAAADPVVIEPARTVLASISSLGIGGNGQSLRPTLSEDGRFLAFDSTSTNLVIPDLNGLPVPLPTICDPILCDDGATQRGRDVFVLDRDADGDGIYDAPGGIATTRVSVATGGGEAHGVEAGSWGAAISDDGRFVAFTSDAPDLVPGVAGTQVYVHDRQIGQTELVSVSGDGRPGNGRSRLPAISADGTMVAFQSYASNLVHGDVNGWADVFVRDRIAGETILVSAATDGTQGNSQAFGAAAISGDGNVVAFFTLADNMVPGDTNGSSDVFVHDLRTRATEAVAISAEGSLGDDGATDPSLDHDGSVVAFKSWATNLVPGDTNGLPDIYVRNRSTGVTFRASVASDGAQGDNLSTFSDLSPNRNLSADGRYLSFGSYATNLAPDPYPRPPVFFGQQVFPDVFVRDLGEGLTWKASVTQTGYAIPNLIHQSSISSDGMHVAFIALAPMTAGDINGAADIYVRSRGAGICVPASPCVLDR